MIKENIWVKEERSSPGVVESSGRDKGEEGAGLKVQVDFFYPGSVEGPV